MPRLLNCAFELQAPSFKLYPKLELQPVSSRSLYPIARSSSANKISASANGDPSNGQTMFHLAKGLYLYATSKEGKGYQPIASHFISFSIYTSSSTSITSPTSQLQKVNLLNTPKKNRILHPPPRSRQRRQNHLPQPNQITLRQPLRQFHLQQYHQQWHLLLPQQRLPLK